MYFYWIISSACVLENSPFYANSLAGAYRDTLNIEYYNKKHIVIKNVLTDKRIKNKKQVLRSGLLIRLPQPNAEQKVEGLKKSFFYFHFNASKHTYIHIKHTYLFYE